MARTPISESVVDYLHTPLKQLLAHEIAQIDDDNIVSMVERVLGKVPVEHAWKEASSSNKYHPQCDLGIGGLVRHTKVVVAIVNEFIRATPPLQGEKDLIIAAAILHDMMKYPHGNDIKTSIKHPDYIADMIEAEGDEFKDIARLARAHQGIFTTSAHETEEVSVTPQKFDEWVLHYADLAASRCFVSFEFDNIGELVMDLWKERPTI